MQIQNLKQADSGLFAIELETMYFAALEFMEVDRSRSVVAETRSAFSGSCFFVTSDGIAFTNHHVIDGATELSITLFNGERYNASVLAQSASTDLAVLRTGAASPSYLSLSRPRSATIGLSVFTVGYPAPSELGTEPKFTDGVISSLSGLGGEAAYLQISVPIQPGNSGGALVNGVGEVVGIVTSTAAIEAFFGATGSLPQNVNWAVKSDYAALLFDPPQRQPPATTREDAIQRAIKASCRVEALVLQGN